MGIALLIGTQYSYQKLNDPEASRGHKCDSLIETWESMERKGSQPWLFFSGR